MTPAGGFDAGRIGVVGFDGDDTLWHCEKFFRAAEDEFAALLTEYAPDPARLIARFHDRMIAGLSIWGYGVKSTILAMLGTALAVSGGQLPGRIAAGILELGERLRLSPLELLPGAEEAVRELAGRHRLWLVTKGDLIDQRQKLDRSGLRSYFDHVEVLSEKDAPSYRELLERFGVPAPHFLMIGNSPRSDILPVHSLGGQTVMVPSPHTWHFETIPDEIPGQIIPSLADLPSLLGKR